MNAGSLVRLLSLSTVLATMVACGEDSMPTATPTPTPGTGGTAANVTITINGMLGNQSYTPNPAPVTVGQTVAWRNADSVVHTATQDGGGFDTGSIAPGATSNPITMTAAGTLAYHCTQHPMMVGTLNVTQ